MGLVGTASIRRDYLVHPSGNPDSDVNDLFFGSLSDSLLSNMIRRKTMGRRALKIILTTKERRDLEGLIRTRSTSQQLALRARIIVLAADGLSVRETSERLVVWRKTVSEWRKRWLVSAAEFAVVDRLSDRPRQGAPAIITPEQICAIIALACEKPSEGGIPISHWSQQAVADEAMRRGIVEKISQRSVGRFFKRVGLEAASHPLLADGQAGSAV